MKLNEFHALLETLGIPVAFHSFEEPQSLPFIAYVDSDSDNFNADNKVYVELKNVTVELYTKLVDDELEGRLKRLFTDNDIPFDWSRDYIDSEKIWETIYEVSLI